MSDWQPIETAPYSTGVLAWLHLPKNPDASGSVIGERCYVQKDEPKEYEEMQQTVGCWWANGRYYHRQGYKAGGGYITHWMPLPEPPA